jgi:hypothetical protein
MSSSSTPSSPIEQRKSQRKRNSSSLLINLDQHILQSITLYLQIQEMYPLLICCKQWNQWLCVEQFWRQCVTLVSTTTLEENSSFTWLQILKKCVHFRFSTEMKCDILEVIEPLGLTVNNPTDSSGLLIALNKPLPKRDCTIRFNIKVERGCPYKIGETVIGLATSYALNHEDFKWNTNITSFVGNFDLPRSCSHLFNVGYADYGFMTMNGKGVSMEQVGAFHEFGIEVNLGRPKPRTSEFIQMEQSGKLNEITYRNQQVVFGTNHDSNNTGLYIFYSLIYNSIVIIITIIYK